MHVSIAMCTYNGARFLREQLESIASQTCLPDELVVCDDGSTDATLGILASYAKVSNFPVRVHCNTIRLGATRNFEQAISLAQGEVIVLSDQDDIWRHDKLQILTHNFSKHLDAGFIFSDAIVINEGGRIVLESLWKQFSFDKKKVRFFPGGPWIRYKYYSRRM